MALPIFQTANKDLSMMETRWAAELNPLLALPINKGLLLTNIKLSTGDNTINTTLGRKYRGYIITGMRDAFVQIYEIPNNNPDLHLVLNSSGSATVDLWVF